jgi:bifunctional DNA-binding transcriptional regulator/antitoxin component of YhaV-PrlF toxin-antitoxin module
MLAKMTAKNQITIPKKVLKSVGMAREDKERYFDTEVINGLIVLKPVTLIVEERLSDEQLAKFEEWATKIERGDKVFDNEDGASDYLRKRVKAI